MSSSSYVISKYHEMSTTQGSEELLVDIESNSRISIFSIFCLDNFQHSYPAEMGFVLKDGSGGEEIYSSGVSTGVSFASLSSFRPYEQLKIHPHGILSLSDLYVEGIGNYGLEALTIFYQVG